MARPVLFLDFDGPLMPTRGFFLAGQPKPSRIFDPIAVGMLNHLIRETQLQVVVTSTIANTGGYDYTCQLLNRNNINPACLHPEWTTWGYPTRIRRDQIQAWLLDHPEVHCWASLDDEDLALPYAVRVSVENGMLLEHYRQLHSILSN